jgi:hypothetical protein
LNVPDWIPTAAAGLFVGYLVGGFNQRRQDKSVHQQLIDQARDQALRELLTELRPIQRRLNDVLLAYMSHDQGEHVDREELIDEEADEDEFQISAAWWQEEEGPVHEFTRRWRDSWFASLERDPEISASFSRWDACIRDISMSTWYGAEPPPAEIMARLDRMATEAETINDLGAQILAGHDPREEPGRIRPWFRRRHRGADKTRT